MPSRLRPPLAAAILLAGAATFVVAYHRLWNYLTDDVFISARYAQHLAAGQGLVYNAGERVEGYTNFLWTLLLTPAFSFGLGLVPWIKWLNALWAFAAAVLAIGIARQLARTGGEADAGTPWWTVLPGALVLSWSPFILSAAEGLETAMFAALLALVVLWTLDAREEERFPRAGLALVALGLTRPGGWSFLPWVVLAGRLLGRSWGWTARMAAVAVAGFAAHTAFRIAYYHDPLPNTFHAKGAGTAFLIDRGWTRFGDFLGATGGWLWLVALLPLVPRRSRGPAAALIAAIALRVAFHLWSGGPWMGRGRFLAPVLPLLAVLLVWGATRVARRGPAQVAVVAATLAFALLPGWQRHAALEQAANQYANSLRAAHQRLGADIAAHTEADAVMAMDDAGLGPLLAGRTNIDMLGLNDRHIGELKGEYATKSDPDYVLDREPDLIVLLSRRPPPAEVRDLFVPSQVPLFEHPRFRERYAFAREYVFAADYHLLLYVRKGSDRVREALRPSADSLSAPPAPTTPPPSSSG